MVNVSEVMLNRSQQSDENVMLGMREAADYLHVSISAMQKYSARRLFPKFRPCNGKVLFRKRDLDDYLNASRISSRVELTEEITNNLKLRNMKTG